MEIINFRAPLIRTKRAIREGCLRIGFTGGSITEQKVWRNWPEPVIGWLGDRWDGLRLEIHNMAIGATGSDLANFLTKGLTEPDCDLVFVEFAVNDFGTDANLRMRTREGLLRKLLQDDRDVVIVYTFCKDMVDDMQQGKIPDSIADFEKLAEHYGLSSIWMGRKAFNDVVRGKLRWEEWLPDGLHPHNRGSIAYAEPVIEFLDKQLKSEEKEKARLMPAPLNKSCWENMSQLDFNRIRLTGYTRIRNCTTEPWFPRFIETSAPGSGAEIPFCGTGMALVFDFGKASGEYRWKLDGGDWHTSCRERPDWCGDRGWYRCEVLFEGIPYGSHVVEIENVLSEDPVCRGSWFSLMAVGILP